MGKTNFQTLKELSSSLAEKLEQLNNGQLNRNEVEALTDQARELYERLVIIRFKSYEGHSDIENKLEKPEEEVVHVESTDQKAEEDDKVDELMMFDFTATEETIEEEETVEKPEEDLVSEESVEEKQVEVPENKPRQEAIDKSLNDNFKKEDGSVAGKFEKAPIKDLKEHIGINRKFLYVNELFGGDSVAYNSAIEKLNAGGSKDAAFSLIGELKSSQKWDKESPTVAGFIELVERRYLI